MGRPLSDGDQILADEVADPVDLFQIPGLRAEGDLYDQCGGGGASPVSQADQDQGRLRQREQFTETAVCRYHAGNRAMDASGTKLEFDAVTDGNSFRGQSE